MKRDYRVIPAAVLLLLSATLANAAPEAAFEVPAWAFPSWTHPPAPGAKPDDVVALQVPGSPRTYTRAGLSNYFAPPDWFPDRHPPMPAVVARGREPDVFACSFCHLPDGTGRPENAALAGLPADYIRVQVAHMRHHLRSSAWTSEPPRSSSLMLEVAAAATDDEVAVAADYFSRLPMRRKAEIIESERVPKTLEVRYIYVLDERGGDEPLGTRLIEVPIDAARHENRDPTVTYRAYVPPGSLKRGRELALTGAGGRTTACITCHGPELKGAGIFPPLAGRSPSYLLRQLLSFKAGTRHAPASASMKPVVAQLTTADMIALAAYVGSQQP